nr:DUF3853 family protein [Parabacteroides goldsteinii]
MVNDLLTKPAYTLTTGELLDLMADKLKSMLPETDKQQSADRKRIDGIVGLAEYLGVSPTTAQKLKTNSKLTFYEAGKCVYFYSDEVDKELRREIKKYKK